MDKSFFVNFRSILVNLYPDEASIRRIMADSDIDASLITLNSTPSNNWHSVLTEAVKTERVDALFGVVKNEYGENKEFRKIYDTYVQSASSSGYPFYVFTRDQKLRRSQDTARCLHCDLIIVSGSEDVPSFQIEIEVKSLVFRRGAWGVSKSLVVLWVCQSALGDKVNR